MKFTYLIGAFIIALMMVAPVAAVNEYRDMNPANDVVDPSTYGYAQFFIRAGGSAQDLNIYVHNVKQNLSFDSRWNPDRTDIPEQNGNWMLVEVLPDGASEKVLLASGQDYQACLRNGNGNQVECQNFIVGGADTTRVVFLGAAVGTEGKKVTTADDTCVDKTNDVTGIVRGLTGWEYVGSWMHKHWQYLEIESDYPHQHYNALFGDPDYGTLKELRVVYKYESTHHNAKSLKIRSAEYGTFCGDTEVPAGYSIKSVMEDEDMDIHYHPSPRSY